MEGSSVPSFNEMALGSGTHPRIVSFPEAGCRFPSEARAIRTRPKGRGVEMPGPKTVRH